MANCDILSKYFEPLICKKFKQLLGLRLVSGCFYKKKVYSWPSPLLSHLDVIKHLCYTKNAEAVRVRVRECLQHFRGLTIWPRTPSPLGEITNLRNYYSWYVLPCAHVSIIVRLSSLVFLFLFEMNCCVYLDIISYANPSC